MTARLWSGPLDWRATQDSEMNREYKVQFQVEADYMDGPATILQTPGLPSIGDPWLVDNDIDLWAFRKPQTTVTPVLTKEKNRFWVIELTYSTKPDTKSCKDQQIENPLLQPQKVNGGSISGTIEAVYDRFGGPIVNSAFEQFRGQQVEFDKNKHTITIEQNVPSLQMDLVTSLENCVNDDTLWDKSRRKVRFKSWRWNKNYYGSCFEYYTRFLEFEIDDETHDRDLLDEGTKVLHGHWGTNGNWVLDNINNYPPDRNNPTHFDRYKDRNGENSKVILNGYGQPSLVSLGSASGNGTGSTTDPGSIHVEYYREANLLLLNIPTSL